MYSQGRMEVVMISMVDGDVETKQEASWMRREEVSKQGSGDRY